MMDFKFGDKVKFNKLGVKFAEEVCGNSGYYPYLGAIGTISEVNVDDCFVQWPKGSTIGRGIWWAQKEFLTKVYLVKPIKLKR